MKWFQDNPFLAGLCAATVVGAGVLAFLLVQALGRFQETTDAYGQAVAKLHGLQERKPYPSEENLAKVKEVSAQYKSQLEALHRQLAVITTPLDPNVGPQQFQDGLRTAVNDIVTKAGQAGVALPRDFYLGFAQYANSLPSEQAAPALARQLVIIKELVQHLIDFKIKSLDVLERTPLPIEVGGRAQAAPQNAPGGPGGRDANRKPNGAVVAGVERFPIDLGFTAEQSKFRVAFNSLLGTDQFLVVRTLNVQNSNPAGPPVAGAAAPDGSTSAIPGVAAAAEAPKNLNVILGQELIKANMRIEIVDFPGVTPEAK